MLHRQQENVNYNRGKKEKNIQTGKMLDNYGGI